MTPAYLAVLQRPAGGILLAGDFTTLAAGGNASVPTGWAFARTGTGATVQTGTSSMVSGIGANLARGGRRLDADPLALVLEETRTNRMLQSRSLVTLPWSTLTFGTASRTAAAAAGPDGVVSATRITTAVSSWGFPQTPLGNTNPLVVSGWGRAVSGTSRWQVNYAGGFRWNPVLTTAWQRLEYLSTAPNAQFYPVDNSGGDTAGEDFYTDFIQAEDGRYATEAIPTTTVAVTRAGERLYIPGGARIVGGDGRVRQYVQFQPKGSSTDCLENKRLLTLGATTYVEFDFATRVVTVVVGGVSYSTAVAMTWAAHALVEIWIAFGGGAPTSVSYRVGGAGAWTTLSTGTPTTYGVIAVAGDADVLCNGTASVFTSRTRRVDFYAPGSQPAGL